MILRQIDLSHMFWTQSKLLTWNVLDRVLPYIPKSQSADLQRVWIPLKLEISLALIYIDLSCLIRHLYPAENSFCSEDGLCNGCGHDSTIWIRLQYMVSTYSCSLLPSLVSSSYAYVPKCTYNLLQASN